MHQNTNEVNDQDRMDIVEQLRRIAQINLNHSAGAYELTQKSLIELKIELIVVCEPYNCLPHSYWSSDPAGTVAVYRNGNTASPPLSTFATG